MINKIKRQLSFILVIAMLLSATPTLVFAAETEEAAYYVCFSSQNYAVRNANKMTLVGDEYVLCDVEIGANEKFFVTDDKGTKYYAVDGDELTTGETGSYSYTVKFSPSRVYSAEENGFARTDCHVTYGFYIPDEISVDINGEPIKMSFNAYFTAYELYVISSVRLASGATVKYMDETHTVSAAGAYRILFTPGEVDGDDTYLFDSDGRYGTGDEYKYNLYIEDAPEYYVTFVDRVICGIPDTEINGEGAFLLSRDESNVNAAEYTGAEFFANECDFTLKYRVYEKTPTGSFALIDDDMDEDTGFSKLELSEVGNYTFSFTDRGDRFDCRAERVTYEHDGWYVLGNMNGWGFTEDGEVDLLDLYRLELIEAGDEDYDEDYDQYRITLYVTKEHLKDGDFEFLITDGDSIFMNLANHIAIDKAGEYELIFSDEHDYGRGRNYRYSLIDAEAEARELIISTPEEYEEFAAACNASAEYSRNLTVYIAKDLDFGGAPITPISIFSGILRGGYHKISGFTFDDDAPHFSLFALVTKDAVVERLVCDVNVSDRDADYVGFVGKNYGTVKYITVSGSLEGADYVGAVVAYNGRGEETTGSTASAFVNGVVKNCVSEAQVIGFSNVGGVVGFNNGELSGCTSRGSVSGNTYSSGKTPINVGGVVGYSAGRITDCENYSPVSSSANMLNVGGIAGQATGDIYFSFNYAPVTGTKYVGGIIGYYGTVTEDEEDLTDYFGGMTYEKFLDYINDDDGEYEQVDGRTHAVYYTANEGNITAKEYVGGIIGYSEYQLPVSLSVSVGSIAANGGGYAGGIAGYAPASEIRECMAAGSVKANGSMGAHYVGGIAGYGGTVIASMSTCDIVGDDYVGGIAGYQVSDLRASYSASLLIVPKSAQNVGDIAGYSEHFNPGTGDFGGRVADNCYVGELGGIGRLEFGSSADRAAVHLTVSQLISRGVLSIALSEGFARENWIASDSESGYPQPKYFFEAAECTYYDNDEEFESIFGKCKEKFAKYAENYASVSFLVSFLEWDDGNGDLLDDDGNVKLSVYDLIHTERIYGGDTSALIAPDFKFAECVDGKWIMKASNANYFVTFTLPTGNIDSNVTVYAEYDEIATTLVTDDGKALIEGSFVKGTVARLIKTERGYTVSLTLNGEEIVCDSYRVKFRTESEPGKYTLSFASADGSVRAADAEISGRYLAFTLPAGEAFALNLKDESLFATVMIAIISAVGGIAVCLLCVAVVSRTKKRKKRRTEADKNPVSPEDKTPPSDDSDNVTDNP